MSLYEKIKTGQVTADGDKGASRLPVTPTKTTVTKPEPETDTYSSDKAIQAYYDMMQQVMKSYTANPLETDWGKQMLEAYGIKADDAATGVKATAAAENSGNVDSYAVANAERQRLAKLGQGIEAINGMNTERNNNLINLLNNIGVNTQTLLGLTSSGEDTSKLSTDDLAIEFGGYYNNRVKDWDEATQGKLKDAVIKAMQDSGYFEGVSAERLLEAANRYLESIGVIEGEEDNAETETTPTSNKVKGVGGYFGNLWDAIWGKE